MYLWCSKDLVQDAINISFWKEWGEEGFENGGLLLLLFGEVRARRLLKFGSSVQLRGLR